jgi:hypothetical protein
MRTLLGALVLAVILGLGALLVLVATLAALIALPIGLFLMPGLILLLRLLVGRRKTPAAMGSGTGDEAQRMTETGRVLAPAYRGRV